MATDLHIHVLENVTEDDYKLFCCNILGSKHYDASRFEEYNTRSTELIIRFSCTPNVWVGEVSWLEAALFSEEPEEYIPGPVGEVEEVMGEDCPVLNEALEARILAAFDLPNTSRYRVAAKDDVAKFLAEHRGKRICTISW